MKAFKISTPNANHYFADEADARKKEAKEYAYGVWTSDITPVEIDEQSPLTAEIIQDLKGHGHAVK